ncbi:MAG TPA: carboxypeptidase-like regulatory domain-containing protein, partial [Bacteroidales bacterium]|nr:carboxypeptidase-like regulatory domain-containing protein [Bacteroidales bacterium]
MKTIFRTFLILLILCSSNLQTFADGDKSADRYTLSGYIKDAENGEVLIGATVYISNLKIGAVTNLYGFYSITLAPGDYKVIY